MRLITRLGFIVEEIISQYSPARRRRPVSYSLFHRQTDLHLRYHSHHHRHHRNLWYTHSTAKNTGALKLTCEKLYKLIVNLASIDGHFCAVSILIFIFILLLIYCLPIILVNKDYHKCHKNDRLYVLFTLSFYGQLLEQLNVASHFPTLLSFCSVYSLLLLYFGQINDDDENLKKCRIRFFHISVCGA